MITAEQLIADYALTAHPEGGYYREVFRSPIQVQSDNHQSKRSALTSIYFLLPGSAYSSWHRLNSDESWFFHLGCDLDIYTLNAAGDFATQRIGHECKHYQFTIPAGIWFAAKPVEPHGFTFVSCTVGPGFEFADFELAKQGALPALAPTSLQHAQLVESLYIKTQ